MQFAVVAGRSMVLRFLSENKENNSHDMPQLYNNYYLKGNKCLNQSFLTYTVHVVVNSQVV